MRTGAGPAAGDTSVPGEFGDAASLGWLSRGSTPVGGSEPGRMPGVRLLWAGRAAPCGMSALAAQ